MPVTRTQAAKAAKATAGRPSAGTRGLVDAVSVLSVRKERLLTSFRAYRLFSGS